MLFVKIFVQQLSSSLSSSVDAWLAAVQHSVRDLMIVFSLHRPYTLSSLLGFDKVPKATAHHVAGMAGAASLKPVVKW